MSKDTVMSDEQRMVALTNLQYRAQAGEDIRWDRVSEVIAQAQDKISLKAGKLQGIREVVEFLNKTSMAAHTLVFQVSKAEYERLLKKWGIR